MHKSIKLAPILILFVRVVLLGFSFGQHGVRYLFWECASSDKSHKLHKSCDKFSPQRRVCSATFFNSRLAFAFLFQMS